MSTSTLATWPRIARALCWRAMSSWSARAKLRSQAQRFSEDGRYANARPRESCWRLICCRTDLTFRRRISISISSPLACPSWKPPNSLIPTRGCGSSGAWMNRSWPSKVYVLVILRRMYRIAMWPSISAPAVPWWPTTTTTSTSCYGSVWAATGNRSAPSTMKTLPCLNSLISPACSTPGRARPFALASPGTMCAVRTPHCRRSATTKAIRASWPAPWPKSSIGPCARALRRAYV